MTDRYKRLIYERKGKDGEVLYLTLNNEKMMNAITETMQNELVKVMGETARDNTIRCVVLTGVGEKVFSAGGDIRLFQTLDHVSAYDLMYQKGNILQYYMTHMEKPLIAAVNGICYAGGLELALFCDFIYCVEDATFGFPEINIGLLPGWGGTVRLPRAIAVRKAKEMIYTGEILTAQEAHQWGLVNKVLPTREALFDEVEKTVAAMMAKPPLTLRAAKNVIVNSITCDSIEAALAIERGSIMWLASSEDTREGISAFIEKRPAHFKGK
jgi:enoyl-CoA hydratase